MLCSEWVPSEWESKQLKNNNNPQVIHTSPVHQLISGEDKNSNKSIIKMLLTKIRVHNNASSSEKVVWSESGENSVQIKQRLQDKTALNKYVAGFWCERWQEMDFYTGGSVMDSDLS